MIVKIKWDEVGKALVSRPTRERCLVTAIDIIPITAHWFCYKDKRFTPDVVYWNYNSIIKSTTETNTRKHFKGESLRILMLGSFTMQLGWLKLTFIKFHSPEHSNPTMQVKLGHEKQQSGHGQRETSWLQKIRREHHFCVWFIGFK